MALNLDPAFLSLLAIVGGLLGGLILLVAGRRLPSRGDWVALFVSVAMAVVAVYVLSRMTGFAESPAEWPPVMWNWILGASPKPALNVGIQASAFGATVMLLASFSAFTLLLVFSGSDRPEASRAAALIAASGTSIAALGATPWTVVLGLAMTGFAGFLAYGDAWQGGQELADEPLRFVSNLALGSVLIVFGVIVLTSEAGDLAWDLLGRWSPGAGVVAGGALVCVGILALFRPFPSLDWVRAAHPSSVPLRALVCQLLVGWTAMALVFRLEPQLREIGIFPLFGWIALGVCILTLIPAGMTSDWTKAIQLLAASGPVLSFAGAGLAGPRTAFQILSGASAGTFALAIIGSRTTNRPEEKGARRPVVTWTKAAAVFAAWIASGMPGSAAAGGFFSMIHAVGMGVGGAAVAVAVLLFGSFSWLIAWRICARKPSEPAREWIPATTALAVSLAGAGIAAAGTLSGGVLPFAADELIPSLVERLFPGAPSPVHAEVNSSVAYWAAIVLGFGIALALRKRRTSSDDAGPALLGFIFKGTGFARLKSWSIGTLKAGAVGLESAVAGDFMSERVPAFVGRTVRAAGNVARRADGAAFDLIERVTRKFVVVPAKAMQLAQSGDVQTYLLLALLVGAGLLVKFLG